MKLGKTNFDFLCIGVKMEGTWEGAYRYAWEYLEDNQDDTIKYFCIWLDKNNKSMGYENYEERYSEYKNRGRKSK